MGAARREKEDDLSSADRVRSTIRRFAVKFLTHNHTKTVPGFFLQNNRNSLIIISLKTGIIPL